METILVTGSAGFIGFHVARRLLEQGSAVIGIDNFNDYYDPALKEARSKQLSSFPGFTLYRGDILNRSALEHIGRSHQIDHICHLAARAGVRASLEDPRLYAEVNIIGTLNIFELARQHHIPSVTYASSSSVYGGNTKLPFSESDPVDHPISPYAFSKKSDELLAYTYHHLYGLHLTGLRFFTVYGPWGRPDMALFKFTKAILAGEPIDVYNQGAMRRSFTYIDDIVDGVLAALKQKAPFAIYNLGNPESVPLMRFIDFIEQAVGKKSKRNFLPLQPGDVPATTADITKAANDLHFKPHTPVEQGIENFVHWYREYYRA